MRGFYSTKRVGIAHPSTTAFGKAPLSSTLLAFEEPVDKQLFEFNPSKHQGAEANANRKF
jgi:hypothetical protein